MRTHRLEDLKVWQKARFLVKEIYSLTAKFPADERFCLTTQMRRCAISVPSNIAEGAGRNNSGEFYHFLGIASGSCYELQTQLILSSDLGLASETSVELLLLKLTEIQKMLYVLKTKIKPS